MPKARMLTANDLQPVLPLKGNEKFYSEVTGIDLEKLKKAPKKKLKQPRIYICDKCHVMMDHRDKELHLCDK